MKMVTAYLTMSIKECDRSFGWLALPYIFNPLFSGHAWEYVDHRWSLPH
jgi:hypothetical protein